ncbi:hypothetical protein CB1_060782035 [Camelus ferus]|nr:hypothetical protein CB1_060782035 [Camelus ferus]
MSDKVCLLEESSEFCAGRAEAVLRGWVPREGRCWCCLSLNIHSRINFTVLDATGVLRFLKPEDKTVGPGHPNLPLPHRVPACTRKPPDVRMSPNCVSMPLGETTERWSPRMECCAVQWSAAGVLHGRRAFLGLSFLTHQHLPHGVWGD